MKEFSDDVNSCFETLHGLIEKSFETMDRDTGTTAEISALWKKNVVRFVNHTYKMSERYKNKEVVKAITKALIFGK